MKNIVVQEVEKKREEGRKDRGRETGEEGAQRINAKIFLFHQQNFFHKKDNCTILKYFQSLEGTKGSETSQALPLLGCASAGLRKHNSRAVQGNARSVVLLKN